jgi:hypothetical protein
LVVDLVSRTLTGSKDGGEQGPILQPGELAARPKIPPTLL